jgi:uncharacterized protein YjiS (DUF1127 family)
VVEVRDPDLEAAMSIKMSREAAIPFRLVLAVGRSVIHGVDRLVRAFRHRQDVAMLAGFDERMLADIGLTRSDVRDAFSEPLWRDPTTVLVDRVGERRSNRIPVTFWNGEVSAPTSAPPIVPAHCGDTTARAA